MNNRHLTSSKDKIFYEKLVLLLPFVKLSSQDWININIVEKKLYSKEDEINGFRTFLMDYIREETQTNNYLNFVVDNFNNFTVEIRRSLIASLTNEYSKIDPSKFNIIAKFLLNESYNKSLIGKVDINVSDSIYDVIFSDQSLPLSKKVAIFNIVSPLNLKNTIQSIGKKYKISKEQLLDAFKESGCLIALYDMMDDKYFNNLTTEDLKRIISKMDAYSQAYKTRDIYKNIVSAFMIAYTLKIFNNEQSLSFSAINDELTPEYFRKQKEPIKVEKFYNADVDVKKIEEIVKFFSDNSFKIPDVIQRLIYGNFRDSEILYRFSQALVGYEIPLKATAFPGEELVKNVPIEHLSRVFNIDFDGLSIENSLVSNANRYIEYKTWNPQENFYDVRTLDDFKERLEQILSHFNSKEEHENPLKQNEIEKLFISFINNTFNLKTELNSFDFDISGEKFTYIWAQLNGNLLTDKYIVPTAQQTKNLLQSFNLVREYLQEEKLYAKLIYTVMNRNNNLSVFDSLEENIKLLNFLFEGPFPAKDDYLREAFDKHNADYKDNEEIANLLMSSIYEQSSKDNSNIVGGEKFLDRYLELLTSDGDKYGIFLWLLTGKNKYQPYRLYQGTIQKEYVKNRYEKKKQEYSNFNYSSLTDMFKTLTKSERELVIRKLLTDVFNKDTVYFSELSFTKAGEVIGSNSVDVNVVDHLANALFDDLNDGSMLTRTVVGVLKDVFVMVMNLFNTERKILFLNALIEGATDISKQKYDNEEEQRARMVGKFIAVMAANIGVIMVKIMQILSNMKVFDDLGEYGKYINEEISAVKSRNEPLSKNVVFQELEKANYDGRNIVVGKKLGSASVAQAFIVNFIRENKKAVVKVKRPTISKNFQDDALIMQVLFSYFKDSSSINLENIVKELFSKFNKIKYPEYVQNQKVKKLQNILNKKSPLDAAQKKLLPNLDKLITIIEEELDFNVEFDNASTLENNVSNRTSATNDLGYTTQIAGVLGHDNSIPHDSDMYFMEQAKGKDLDKLERADISKKEKSAIYYSVLKEFFKEAFEEGFYHADLHQGNVFVDGRNIMLIDFGACGKIKNDTIKKSLKDIFIMAYLGDYDMFVSALSDYNPNISKDIDAARLQEILTGKTSIEQKLVDLYELFNRQESMDEDLLMFFQGLSKIGKYLDNLSNRDMLLLVIDDVFIYDLLGNDKLKNKLIGILNTLDIPNQYRKIIDNIIERINSAGEKDKKELITTIKSFLLDPNKKALEKGVKNIIDILNLPGPVKLLVKPLLSKIDVDSIAQWLNSFGTVDEQKEGKIKQEDKKAEVIKEKVKVDRDKMKDKYNKDELIELLTKGQIRIEKRFESEKNISFLKEIYINFGRDYRSNTEEMEKALDKFIADLETKNTDEQKKILEEIFKGQIQVKKVSVKGQQKQHEMNISAVINGKECVFSVSSDSLSMKITGVDNEDGEAISIIAKDAFKTMINETDDKYYTFIQNKSYYSTSSISVFSNVGFSDHEYYNIDEFFSELEQLSITKNYEEIKRKVSYLFDDKFDIRNVSVDNKKTNEKGYLTNGNIIIDAEVPGSVNEQYTIYLYFNEKGELGINVNNSNDKDDNSTIKLPFGVHEDIFCDALSRVQINLSQEEFAEMIMYYISKYGKQNNKYEFDDFIMKLNTNLPFRQKVIKALEKYDYYSSVEDFQDYFENILLQERANKRFDYHIFIEQLKFYVSPVQNLTKIIEELFDSGNDDNSLMLIRENQQIKDYNYNAIKAAGMNVSWYEIEKGINKDLKGGKIIGIINGKIIRVYQNSSHMLFYSKQGLDDIDESDIENLFMEAISNGVKSIKIKPGRVIAFTRPSDSTVADMINRLNNAKTNSIMTTVNLRYELREKNKQGEYIKISKEVCDGIRASTGRNIFMITREQAERDAKAIAGMEDEYTFIVVSETEEDLINDLQNATEEKDSDFILDMTAKTMTLEQVKELMERLRTAKLQSKKGVTATILVKFNSNTTKELKNFNFYEEYGIIPILHVQDISFVAGKKEVYDVLDEQQIEKLKGNDVSGFIIDRKLLEERKGKKYGIRDFLANLSLVDKDTPERRYKKGAIAAMSSPIDYKVTKMEAIMKMKDSFLSADLSNAQAEVEKINKTVLSWFNADTQKYINDLKQKGQYAEVLGFMRGVVMRTIAEEISSTLELEDGKLHQDIKESNIQAILIITIQKMMNGEKLEEMYKQEMAGSDTLTAEEFFNQIRFRLNKDMEEVLRKNEYKIIKVDPDKVANFNGIPEILMDSYKKKATVTQQVQVSAKAVRSILVAA